MSFRQSDTDKLKQEVKPDMFKSDAEQTKEQGQGFADKAASYLPGQSKTRDAFDSDARDPNVMGHDAARQGAGSIGNSWKPSGAQSTGDWVNQKMDQGASYFQPNETKSTTQKAEDALKPGNDSGVKQESQGVLDQAAGVVGGAKDAVVNAFSGAGYGQNTTHERR